MPKKGISLLCWGALILAVNAFGGSFEIAVWKGETSAVRIRDNVELGEPPVDSGIALRRGVIKTVKYALEPESLQRSEVCDRVVWDCTDAGPRVVEVSVTADAKSGVYACGMVNIRIVDRSLPPPSEWMYFLDLWQHPWAVVRMAKAKPFSKEHYAAMKPVWELLASAGQKTITVTILEQPWDHQCFDAYHSMMTDDFRLFDEYVEFCRECGLGPYISCYSLCPWTQGKSIDADVLEKRWGAFFNRFAAHLKEKGWYDNTYMAMDEREPEDVRKVVEFVRRHAPGMKVSMAGNRKPSDFKGIDIDCYSQILLPDCLTEEFLREAAERKKRGLRTTFYTCCFPDAPNTFMSNGAGEAFWLGAFPAVGGLDGYLRWAWNSWPRNPNEDASFGSWKSGDTFLVYPGGAPSWRFLELRNGIIASEKISILRGADVLGVARQRELQNLFDVQKVISGEIDFKKARDRVMSFVNAE